MTEAPYIPFYTSDFLAGTGGMTAATKGVYITLLCMMYDRERPLSQDWATLARRCGCTPAAFKKAVSLLQDDEKITVTDEGIWSDKCTKHIALRRERSNSATASAKKRWEKNKENQGKADANAMRTQCERNAIQNQSQNIKNNVHFAQFWNVWPYKKSKSQAEKAWAKIPANERQEVIARTPAWCRQWREDNPQASHILPASYLNGRRWEDEASTPHSAGKVDHGWFGVGRDYSHA